MAEPEPSYRSQRVPPEVDGSSSLFVANNAVIRQTPEQSVNLSYNNGVGILITALGTVTTGTGGLVIG